MKGGYDMLIYANSVSRSAYAHWDKGMQVLLADYKASWYPSEIAHKQLGFFPIRNEMLDRAEIDDRYKRIITFLNQDSRASFREMAEELDMRFHILIYNFKKLLKTDYIRRFTIVEKPVANTVTMYYFAKLTLTGLFAQCAANARKALMYDDQYPLVSRYSFCSQLIGSGDFFVMGVFDNKKVGYRNGVLYYKKAMESQNANINYGIIDKVLVGSMPLRSVDDKKEYHVLKWNPELALE
jgi:DNA-binding Lrp family transcriptional regulator